jgi:indole-3-glycerol phosphate synthase
VFNLLGPLSNPAGAPRQIIGVWRKDLGERLAHVLSGLGTEHAWVVHGEDGLDEITLAGKTHVAEAQNGEVKTFEIGPSDFGFDVGTIDHLRGGDAEANAEIVSAVLTGERRDEARALVIMNAAAALFLGGVATDLSEGATLAASAIDSGEARRKLELLIEATSGPKPRINTELERMNVLSEIIAKKRERVREAKSRARPHAFRGALEKEGINVIAEFKRRSPSKGVIREGANAIEIARAYQAGGAVAMSVLTEEDYFAGSLEDLRQVKAAVELPVLRKDFIVDEYQVYESAAAGADAILLIVAALDDELLVRLRRLAEDELGMDALVEVHTSDEVKRAAACGATLIGVNNRDLRTFEVSLETSLSLAASAPADALLISESGLKSADDLQRLHDAGYRGFLIGETLMRANDPEAALRSFRGQK